MKLAKTLNKIENIKLSEIVANSELDISSAKLLLKYIEDCLNSDIQQEPDENIERLLKRALNMELKDYSVLNLMINLDVGVCTARVLQRYLLEFLEEEGSEVVGESENEEGISAEGKNEERDKDMEDEEEETFL